MQQILRYTLSVLFASLLYATGLFAQEAKVHIDSIEIYGNKKTRPNIILRELGFHQGDSISMNSLMSAMKENERYLLNTKLFQAVQINISKWENKGVWIKIMVKEGWYIYPLPIVELADRNFNVWWVEQQHRLNRLNLGGALHWQNLTGNNDLLNALVQFGYSWKFGAEYTIPFINRKKTIGLSFNGYYGNSREVNYTTTGDKVQFFSSDSLGRLFKDIRGGLSIIWRPGLFHRGDFSLNYYNRSIADTVAHLNPDFFINDLTRQQILSFTSQYTLDRRDIAPYPTSGYYINARLVKTGLGLYSDIDNLYAYLVYGHFVPLGHNVYLSGLFRGRKYFYSKEKLPYFNSKALGYGADALRGYEYYVINGQDFAMLQFDLYAAIYKLDFRFSQLPVHYLRDVPIRFYARVHADAGYAQDKWYTANNALANTLLYSAGLSLDIVFMYNFVGTLDFSVNKMGEAGLFLRNRFKF